MNKTTTLENELLSAALLKGCGFTFSKIHGFPSVGSIKNEIEEAIKYALKLNLIPDEYRRRSTLAAQYDAILEQERLAKLAEEESRLKAEIESLEAEDESLKAEGAE